MPSFDYDITSAPYSQVVPQATFNSANQVIFRFTSAVKTMLGFRTNSGGTFHPRFIVLGNDGTTILRPQQSGAAHHFHMLTPDTYYIKVTRSGGGASNFDFTFDFDTCPLDDFTIEEGDLLINDDEDLPATLLAADGTLKSYVSAVPGGEIGGILPNRISAWYDAFSHYHVTNRVAIIGADLQYVTSVDVGDTGQPNILAGRTKFWVITHANELWTVTDAGVAANTGYTFPTPRVIVGVVNVDETVLYWAYKSNDGIIHALDLNTLTDLPDFYVIPGFVVGSTDEIADTVNNNPGDMHTLDDGTIVGWWYDYDAVTFHVLHWAADGTLLHDHEFSYDGDYVVNHLAIIYGQSDDILIWLTSTEDFSSLRIGRLNLASGTITDDFISPTSSDGYNLSDGPELFVPSASCTFVRYSVTEDDEDGEIDEGMIGPYTWVHFKVRVP